MIAVDRFGCGLQVGEARGDGCARCPRGAIDAAGALPGDGQHQIAPGAYPTLTRTGLRKTGSQLRYWKRWWWIQSSANPSQQGNSLVTGKRAGKLGEWTILEQKLPEFPKLLQ